MNKLDFNHREFTVNLRSMCRVTGWIIAVFAIWTVCADASEVIKQHPTLQGTFNFKSPVVPRWVRLLWALYPSCWYDIASCMTFSMMGQIRSVLIGLCKGWTQLEGLEGCSGLLLCPCLTFAVWLLHLNTKDILSWHSCKPYLGVKDQPTTSCALYFYEWSFCSTHYNHRVILSMIYIDVSFKNVTFK